MRIEIQQLQSESFVSSWVYFLKDTFLQISNINSAIHCIMNIISFSLAFLPSLPDFFFFKYCAVYVYWFTQNYYILLIKKTFNMTTKTLITLSLLTYYNILSTNQSQCCFFFVFLLVKLKWRTPTHINSSPPRIFIILLQYRKCIKRGDCDYEWREQNNPLFYSAFKMFLYPSRLFKKVVT